MKEKEFTVPEAFIHNVTKDTASYLFQQAEKCLIETIQASRNTTDRAYRLLSILIPSTVAASGFAFAKFNKSEYDFLLLIISLTLVFLIATIINIYRLIEPRKIMLNGSQPSNLLKEETLKMYENFSPKTESYEEEELKNIRLERQVIGFYLWETQNFESRILLNRATNEQRSKILVISLKLLFWMTITDVILIISHVLYSIFLTST